MNKVVWRIVSTAALAATLSAGTALAQPHSGTPHTAMAAAPTDLATLRADGVERPAAETWHGRVFRLGVAA